MRKTLVVAVAGSLVAAVPLACSSSKPPPPVTPTTDMDAAAEGGAFGAADDGGHAAFDASAFDAAGAFAYLSGDGGTTPATPTNPGGDDAALDAALAAAAAKHAPKMTPAGSVGRATLAPNEHFNMIVNMEPGRCYTIIGVSAPGQVQQLDLKLLMPPFYTVMAGNSGANDKNTPVIGKGTQALCPIIPLAVPYKVDAVATKGAGRIAVQAYARSK